MPFASALDPGGVESVLDAVGELIAMLWTFIVSLPGPTLMWLIIIYCWILFVAPSPFRRRRAREKEPKWYFTSTVEVTQEPKPAVDPVSTRVARNKRDVIGWELFDPSWLEKYEPRELQAKIDEASQYNSLIQECLAQLKTPEMQVASNDAQIAPTTQSDRHEPAQAVCDGSRRADGASCSGNT